MAPRLDSEPHFFWQVCAGESRLTQTYQKGSTATVHRIDLSCEQTGFTRPPCAVHLKFLPSPAAGETWTLLAQAAAGRPDQLAPWLSPHPGITNVRVAPGLAPKLLRASITALPVQWASVASLVKVHHLNLAPDGNASWFIEGVRDQVLPLVRHLEAVAGAKPMRATEVRCRPVSVGGEAPITRRQFEALSTAVALGYYEIPHRLDLRALAARTGLSVGSVSELLRRAERAILTHHIDSSLMGWPKDAELAIPLGPIVTMVRPGDADRA